MYFLIYSSFAAFNLQEDDLKALLIQSGERNKKLSVTGMLLYFDGKFLQHIEGEERDIKMLYNSICNDGRHKNIVTLMEDNIEKRFFEDWFTGFKPVSSQQQAGAGGYKNLNGDCLNTSSALKLFKILALQK